MMANESFWIWQNKLFCFNNNSYAWAKLKFTSSVSINAIEILYTKTSMAIAGSSQLYNTPNFHFNIALCGFRWNKLDTHLRTYALDTLVMNSEIVFPLC